MGPRGSAAPARPCRRGPRPAADGRALRSARAGRPGAPRIDRGAAVDVGNSCEWAACSARPAGPLARRRRTAAQDPARGEAVDLGGIGKGLALASGPACRAAGTSARTSGLSSMRVVTGSSWMDRVTDGSAWSVGLEDPCGEEHVGGDRGSPMGATCATKSRRHREPVAGARWATRPSPHRSGGRGSQAARGLLSVTVVAGDPAWGRGVEQDALPPRGGPGSLPLAVRAAGRVVGDIRWRSRDDDGRAGADAVGAHPPARRHDAARELTQPRRPRAPRGSASRRVRLPRSWQCRRHRARRTASSVGLPPDPTASAPLKVSRRRSCRSPGRLGPRHDGRPLGRHDQRAVTAEGHDDGPRPRPMVIRRRASASMSRCRIRPAQAATSPEFASGCRPPRARPTKVPSAGAGFRIVVAPPGPPRSRLDRSS